MKEKEKDWREDALCRELVERGEINTELFFPIGSTGPAAVRQIEKAKTICFACPVRRECRAEAEDRPGTDGIWGATSFEDRLEARRRAKRLARA